MSVVDLNSDVGESFGRCELGDDAAMLALVTSANVACGFHAGDPTTLRRIGALDGICRAAGTGVRYVKPHGALYNAIVHHEAQAAAVVAAVRAYDPELPVLGLPGSVFLAAAEAAGLRTVREFFVDRGYTPDATLVPRSQPGALLHDPQEVTARVLRMVTDGKVTAVDGTDVHVNADSACVHGDSPGAVAMAEAVRAGLEAAGVQLRPFVEESG